jgi:Ran GTPase-activating protein (RanGAP) involved in mRNA processing and transport
MADMIAQNKNGSLRFLRLWGNGLGAEGASLLSHALAASPSSSSTLTALDLRQNSLADEGVENLCSSLVDNKHLIVLLLNKNKISSKGAAALFDLLHRNRTMTCINLGSNALRAPNGTFSTSNWTRVLCDPGTSLVELNLGYNRMGESGASVMTEALTRGCTLTILNLRANDFEAEAAGMFAEALCCNSVLTDLNLADNPFGSAGLCQLSEGLSGNASLTALSCENCAAGAWGAGPLAEGLQHNSTLRKLNLAKNCMGAEGAALLAFALTSNPTLDSLDLRGDGAATRYFASRFRPGQLGKHGQIKLVGSWSLLFDACRANESRGTTAGGQ